MSDFLTRIKERARADKKTIILPESMDRRIYEAAEMILSEDIANIIIIGTPEEVEANSKGLDIAKATIINPFTYEKTEESGALDAPIEGTIAASSWSSPSTLMSGFCSLQILVASTTLSTSACLALPIVE